MTRILIGLAIVGCALSTPGAAQTGSSSPPDRWAQFRGSPALTGVSDAKLPDHLKAVWTYDAGDAIESSAAIADGVVYVGDGVWDLRAARRLGHGFVGVGGDRGRERLVREGASVVLRDFTDLEGTVAALSAAAVGK